MANSAREYEDRMSRVASITDSGSVTVLHVEDDPDFADLVAVYLEREGESMEVLTTGSAEEALERLDGEDIDCIVSDYDMPGRDGLELLQAVREEHPDLPFILFTGKGSEEIASEAISAGVTDYLQKEGGTDQYTVLANRIENVTTRQQVERAVERSFRAIETAREGIAFLDEEGTFTYVNPAYADTYGYEREELYGEHWEVLYPEDHVDRVYEEILPAVPETGRWTGESIHVRKDGERLVVNHALAHTDDGTMVCLIQDITERKRTERALEEERQRFERFVDAVEEYAIFTLDADGFVTSWNRGAERLKGYSEAEILGQHFSTFYPEGKVEAGRPEELLTTARETGSAETTGWRVRADGSRFLADVVISAVFDEEDRLRGFLKVTHDRTDELASEEAIREEEDEALIQRAVDVLKDVFYVLDAEGNILRVTDRATEVTGYSREELLSMSPSELFVPGDRARIREDIEEALATGTAEVEAEILTADGRTIPYEFRKRRLTDEDGTILGVAGVGRDITERKRRERQLRRQLEQFEHFGSVLGHDIRTPLNTARGRLELARDTGEFEHVRKAETALDRLEELVADLSEVMRQGELVNDIEAVDLAECLGPVWESLETAEATLELSGAGTIRADERAVKRLAENLFRNALVHAGSDVTVTVETFPDGFAIEDDGPGIPEPERERVFDAGYSTGDGGTGFGLASVKQLVVAHGWEVTIADGEAAGARFEVTDVEVLE